MSAGRDFPFYAGDPVAIRPAGWALVILSVIVAFALLVSLPLVTVPLSVVPAILYTGLPLLTLALVSKGNHSALFGRFGIKGLGLALGFGVLCLLASMAVGLILLQFVEMTPNAATEELAGAGPLDVAGFMVRTFIQLVGEELMTVLPLLAVLWLCVTSFGLSRRAGLVIAVAVSTAWFAAVHLPTYDWNAVQCFAGIGTARLVLTAAYLLTRNLWVSAGAHIVNDWTEFFGGTLLRNLAHGPIDAGG